MFRLYFMHSNFTDVRTVKEAGAHLQYKLEGLGNKISFILLVLVNNLKLGGREKDQACKQCFRMLTLKELMLNHKLA